MIKISTNIKLIFLGLFLIYSSIVGNEKKTDSQETELIGKWELVEFRYSNRDQITNFSESEINSIGLIWNLSIESDGSIQQTTNIGSPILTKPGTWRVSGNKLTMVLSGQRGRTGTLVFNYRCQGETLVFTWASAGGIQQNEAKFRKTK